MSLALQSGGAAFETIDFSTCPLPVDLEIGKSYLLTDLWQGSLGDFNVIAVAISATQFADSVTVFPANAPVDKTGWPGILNFSLCKLVYLQDYRNNQVSGTTNIQVFPWFTSVATRVTDNVIDSAATINLGGNAFAGTFVSNDASAYSSITISGPAIAEVNLIIEGNTWKRISFSLGTAITTSLSITNNSFLEANSLVDGAIEDIGTITISNNLVTGNGSIAFGGAGTTLITNNIIRTGNITAYPRATKNHTIENNDIAGGSIVSGYTTTNVTVTGNHVSGDIALNTVGGTVNVTKNMLTPNSYLDLTAPSAAILNVTDNFIAGTVLIGTGPATLPEINFSFSTILDGGNTGGGVSYDLKYVLSGAIEANTVHNIFYLTQLRCVCCR